MSTKILSPIFINGEDGYFSLDYKCIIKYKNYIFNSRRQFVNTLLANKYDKTKLSEITDNNDLIFDKEIMNRDEFKLDKKMFLLQVYFITMYDQYLYECEKHRDKNKINFLKVIGYNFIRSKYENIYVMGSDLYYHTGLKIPIDYKYDPTHFPYHNLIKKIEGRNVLGDILIEVKKCFILRYYITKSYNLLINIFNNKNYQKNDPILSKNIKIENFIFIKDEYLKNKDDD